MHNHIVLDEKYLSNVEPMLEELRLFGFTTIELDNDDALRIINVARDFYSMPLGDRIRAAAFMTNGVLGYYPSESVAKVMRISHGIEAPTFEGNRVRGYCSFDFIANDSVCQKSRLFHSNHWPSDADFRKEACLAYAHFVEFARRVCNAIIAELSRSGRLHCFQADAFEGDCCSLMRLLRYGREKSESVSKPHTDYEFLSFVISDGEGLEVRGLDGTWRSAFAQGSVMLLSGDMLEVASMGWIRSALHRVRFGRFERHSVIFFQGLGLDQEFDYFSDGRRIRSTFGTHLSGMLVRGAAHLQNSIEVWEKILGVAIPERNPFCAEKDSVGY